MENDTRKLAAVNFQGLRCNPYPGRIIVLGRTPDDSLVQIYAIMVRSEGSRNRVLDGLTPHRHGWLRTRVADPTKHSGDPELLIYNAMAESPGVGYVVSNGKQTDDVAQNGISALDDWQYEPDKPNFTPRITGVTRHLVDGGGMQLSLLRKSPLNNSCDHLVFSYNEVMPGYGYFISTYMGDEDPLPSFHGEPRIVPIDKNAAADIAETYWAALNKSNRVSLAVKVISPDNASEVAIANRHSTDA